MSRMKMAGATLLALSMSTFLGACSADEDTSDRAALERESLNRELEMALQTDTTQQPTLTDIPLEPAELPAAPPVRSTRTRGNPASDPSAGRGLHRDPRPRHLLGRPRRPRPLSQG